MTRAIVANRTDDPPAETDEIAALAEAAGYEVCDRLSQVRSEDPGTDLGRGKVAELADRVAAADAAAVVVDGRLTPSQTHGLAERLPPDTEVRDRYRLVLDVFAEGARTERASLQVELARLRYELPRLRERAEEGLLNTRTERGSAVYDVENRIERIERRLDELPDPTEQFRERRREEGFDLVTLAGYTNAGKSTLLRRLADEMSLEQTAPAETGERDRATSAAVADRLFETLETTTRRATLGERPALVTDTVGYVSDLPHWLVESFGETLSEAAAADAVVLVVDASDEVPTLREKAAISTDVLAAQGVAEERIVTALNKVDCVDDDALAERREAVADVAPEPVVPVSVATGRNVDDLVDAVRATLPTTVVDLRMPAGDNAMAVASEAHDRLAVREVEYGDTVRVVAEGPPRAVDRLRGQLPAGSEVETAEGGGRASTASPPPSG